MNNYYKNLAFFSFILLIVNSTSAYNLKQIVNKENLSNSSITSLCQDDKGLMWIGTCDGLNIYNSREVMTYQPTKEKSELTGNLIDKIIYTEDNIYWIQTYYGLNKLDTKTNTVEQFSEFRKLFLIEKDNNNNIFIIQDNNGISYYSKKNNSFKKIYISGIILSDIIKFFIDKNNTMWIITNKGYNFNFKISTNNTNGDITLTPQKTQFYNQEQLLYCFFEDNCIYYIDKYYDFFAYDISKNEKKYIYNLKNEIQQKGKISSIIKYHDSFFVGFSMGGLFVFEKQQYSDIYYCQQIEINCGVFCLKKDSFQDIVWIGTDGQGVYIYSNTAYSIKSTVLNNITRRIEHPVRALFLDQDKTLWIGSKGDGVLKIFNYDINENISNCKTEILTSENSFLENNAVYCFAKSKRDILWIGNEGGLNYYSYGEKKVKKISLNIGKLPFKFIHDIYETNNSELWIASVGMGIIRAKIKGTSSNPILEDIKHYTINNGDFESNYFFCIYPETDSKILFGNRGYGSFRFNSNTSSLEPLNLNNKYNNQTLNDVFTINKDNQNHYLFGTSYGLIRYKSSEDYEVFNSKNGFLSNTIHTILKGTDNDFWLSTNRGIIVFDTKKSSFHSFDQADGLDVVEFSDGAAFKDTQTNTMFFGGINGFVSIKENKKNEQKYMPPIIFDKLTIFGKYSNIIEMLEKQNNEYVLNLKHEQNFFTVSFTAIDYLYGSNNTYYYKLDGLSDEWINNGHSNAASFTNISPGNYTLKVKYYNSTHDKESPIYTLKIHIEHPWYQSILAYCIYLIIAIVLVRIIIRYYTLKKNQKKQKLIDEIEQKHTKDVFESKLRFFTNIAHEFCTPLTLISGSCERILAINDINKVIVDYAQLIKKNADRLNNLIRELIEFRRIETENRELEIEAIAVSELINDIMNAFKDVSETKNIQVDSNLNSSIIWNSDRGFLTTIIFNLLSNAFKYTHSGKRISLDVKEFDSQLIIKIANEGSSINEDDFLRVFDRYTILDNFENQDRKLPRNGLGLAISFNMVRLLEGAIEVENTPDNWVIFTVKLPFIEIEVKHTQPIKINLQNYVPTIEPTTIKQLPKYEFNEAKPTILIIDDNIEMLWFMGSIFADEFNVMTLQDSTKIDELLMEIYPSLIICDVMMPELDGFELIKRMKSTKETSHIPIILVSGNFEIEQQIDALSLGAEMYITKPFNTDFLKVTVVQIIERKEKLKDYFSSPICSYEFAEGKFTHKEHKKFMHSVLNVINENIINKDLSTQFIADELGMGSRSLYRKIEEIGGQSPSTLIKECRLFIAKDLLIKTKLTIDEVVYKSGFSNKVTFFKSFHKRFGCTPKEYRMKSTNNITIETMVNIDNKSF